MRTGRRGRTGSSSALDDLGVVDSARRSFVAVVDDRVCEVVERSCTSHCENDQRSAQLFSARNAANVPPTWLYTRTGTRMTRLNASFDAARLAGAATGTTAERFVPTTRW